MKFSYADSTGNIVRSYAPGCLTVNNTAYTQSVVLTVDSVSAWDVTDIRELSAAHVDALLVQGPDLILLGTGARQVCPARTLFRALAGAGIGVEVMATGAAARTFNVLIAEDRRVVAALIV